MNVKGIIGGILVAGATLSLSSCYKKEATEMFDGRKQLLETVMRNNPQRELDSLNTAFIGDASGAQRQHAIDSIIFRNVFEGSNKAKDSAFVTDYNNMMRNTKTPILSGGLYPNNKQMEKKLHDILSVSETEKINKNPLMNERNYFGIGRQYLIDSVYHHKLFEKHGLLDENGAKIFKDACKKVRP